MAKHRIKVYYFSPTGGTLAVARHLAEALCRELRATAEYHSYTLPRERESLPVFAPDDIILWATPVYAGRIPNKTLDFVRAALSRQPGVRAIALVAFGNRAYDNALAELVGLMHDGGMRPLAAAAMVTRHAFSNTLGSNRPNEADLAALDRFGKQAAGRILTDSNDMAPLNVPGEAHPEKYYTPLKTNNVPAGFLKAKPACDNERCLPDALCGQG